MTAWRLGLMTNLANRTAIFVASLFSATLPSESSWSDGLLIIAVMIAISLAWYGAVALTLGGAGRVEISPLSALDRCRRGWSLLALV